LIHHLAGIFFLVHCSPSYRTYGGGGGAENFPIVNLLLGNKQKQVGNKQKQA
jgi:hypothetical protein